VNSKHDERKRLFFFFYSLTGLGVREAHGGGLVVARGGDEHELAAIRAPLVVAHADIIIIIIIIIIIAPFFFLTFPFIFVRPEPVLVNHHRSSLLRSIRKEKELKRKRIEKKRERKRQQRFRVFTPGEETLFLGCFPMFVPSLSW
jgi:hypothetical protein